MICNHCGEQLPEGVQFCLKCGKQNRSNETAETVPLLRRAMLFLQDREWGKADDYCERVLDQEPENPQAYLIKLMLRAQVTKEKDLGTVQKSFAGWNSYQMACRFASEELRQRLEGYLREVEERIRVTQEQQQRQAEELERQRERRRQQEIMEAQRRLGQERQEREKKTYDEACHYARPDAPAQDLQKAVKCFAAIPNYRDASERLSSCKQRLQKIQLDQLLQEERRKKQTRVAVILVIAMVLVVILLCVWGFTLSSNEDRAERIKENLRGKSFTGTYNAYDSYQSAGSWGTYGERYEYQYTYKFQWDGTVDVEIRTRYDKAPFTITNGETNWDWVDYDSNTVSDYSVSVSFFSDVTVQIDGVEFQLNVNEDDVPTYMKKEDVTYR